MPGGGVLDAIPIGILMFLGTVGAIIWHRLRRRRAVQELPELARELALQFTPSRSAGMQGRLSGRHRGYEVCVDAESRRGILVRFNAVPAIDLRTYDHSARPRFGWAVVRSGNSAFDQFFKTRFASASLAQYLADSERPGQYVEPFVGAFARRVQAVTVTSDGVTCQFDFGSPPYIPVAAIRALLPACVALAAFVESGVAAASSSTEEDVAVPRATPREAVRSGGSLAPNGTADHVHPEAQVSIAALLQEALEHQGAGRLVEAALAYREVLLRVPDHTEATFRLGSIALASGRADSALDLFEKAVLNAEGDPRYHLGVAEATRLLGRFAESLDAVERALSIEPSFCARVPDLCGFADLPSTFARRGWLLVARAEAAVGHAERAVTRYRQALAVGPNDVPAWTGLGAGLEVLGSTDEAAQCFRRALEIQPRHREAAARLLSILQASGRLDEVVVQLRRHLESSERPEARSLLLMSLPYVPGSSDAEVLREARVFDRIHARSLRPATLTFGNDPSPARRLRVGYLSQHFREHSHKYFSLPLLANHDREQVEVVIYADVAAPDAETEQLHAVADVWRDVASLDDGALADSIRADGVDILVDLSMHTQHNRLLVFARKPAPVQLCWLAYPGTTGLTAMDYRVTDPHLDPALDPALGIEDGAGSQRSPYAERALVLPDSFWCYTPRESDSQVSQLPALAAGHVTFGCLNDFVKLNADVLGVWAELLSRVQNSRLVLLAPPGDARARVLLTFAERGVEPERVSFVDRCSRTEYLAIYARIDIALDTFPCCGHTTSLDALWMGVPVVTLAGDTVIGRSGVSIAMNLGLPEWVAKTPQEYVQIAARWAHDASALSQLRAGLRARMAASPLMDGPRFARNMEALYRRAWSHWAEAASNDGSVEPEPSQGVAQVFDHRTLS